MQTHEHTIMVWLEDWLSVFPCLEGRGMFLEKAETQWFLSLQWKEGLAKGGVIYFTSVGSGGILGFTCTTFPVYSERMSKVCACEFTGHKTSICDMQELLIMQVFDVTTVITSTSRSSKVPVFVNVMFFFARSITFCNSQPTRWSLSSVTMIWTHQPNVHIHQECCLLPLRLRRHTGTVFSILDVNHATKLTTKSLTHHEFFMKFTIMWLEKVFYWLLIQILLLILDLKLQKCSFKLAPQTDAHQYTVGYGLEYICVKNIFSHIFILLL